MQMEEDLFDGMHRTFTIMERIYVLGQREGAVYRSGATGSALC
jgi:hypothetical protein